MLEEHDLRGQLDKIDASRTSVYVLSGEYDWSATPAASRELASAIPGAEFTLMRGLGHFPMAEDPTAFRAHLVPVLEKIVSAG